MEQVTFTPQTSGLYILDGQAFFIKNGLENSISSGNGDIVQQALSGLTLVNNDTDQSEVNFIADLNKTKHEYVLLDQGESEEGPVVQLSISDDYPMQFLNDETNSKSVDSGSLKNNLSLIQCENSSTDDLLQSLLTSGDNIDSQFELLSPLKNNCTYTYQLTNGELCPLTEAATNTPSLLKVTPEPGGNCSGVSATQGTGPKVSPMRNGYKLASVSKSPNGVGRKPRLKLIMKTKNGNAEKKWKSKNTQLVSKPFHIENMKNYSKTKERAPPVVPELQNEIVNAPKFVIRSSIQTLNPESEPSLMRNDDLQQQTSHLPQPQSQSESEISSAPTAEKKEQPGDTTKKVGKLTQSQLKKIAAVFRNSCLNRSRLPSSLEFESETNQRVVCRVVYPEDLIKSNDKRVVKKAKKRARLNEPEKKPTIEEEKTKKVPPPTARTRSGRLSRPPRYMVKDFKKLTEDAESSYSDYVSEENGENTPLLDFPELQQRKISTKYHCPTCNKVYLGNNRMTKHFSKHPDHDDGKTLSNLNDDLTAKQKQLGKEKNTWRKIFRKGVQLNKLDIAALLKELFDTSSKENVVPVASEWLSKYVEPWDYLKVRQRDRGVKGLLSDLSSIMNSIPKDLLSTALPGEPGSFHIVDEGICRLLNISPGHYMPNESTLKSDEIKNTSTITGTSLDLEQKVETATSCWDAGTILGNDDKMELEPSKEIIGDISKVDTSELNEILLDKSSLESVDRIVSERLNDLILTSPLDVGPLVETQVLARSILSSSPDLLHSVSGSTEDLLKTLDNLSPDLPSDPASDFDFTVLSSDFVSDR